MNKIQQTITTALLSVSLGIGGFVVGKASLRDEIENLDKKVETTQLEKNKFRKRT